MILLVYRSILLLSDACCSTAFVTKGSPHRSEFTRAVSKWVRTYLLRIKEEVQCYLDDRATPTIVHSCGGGGGGAKTACALHAHEGGHRRAVLPAATSADVAAVWAVAGAVREAPLGAWGRRGLRRQAIIDGGGRGRRARDTLKGEQPRRSRGQNAPCAASLAWAEVLRTRM